MRLQCIVATALVVLASPSARRYCRLMLLAEGCAHIGKPCASCAQVQEYIDFRGPCLT
jgi:hypothetical protein